MNIIQCNCYNEIGYKITENRILSSAAKRKPKNHKNGNKSYFSMFSTQFQMHTI